MSEFVIDYAVKTDMDMSDKEFARHIKRGVIRECKGKKKKQREALEIVNQELQFHGYKPTSLSTVKHYWKDKSKTVEQ